MAAGRVLCRFVLGAFVLSCAATFAAQSHLGPFEYQSDFRPNPGAFPESGSRDGWESYPLAQDAGYDPTVNPETLNGESSLVREMAPTQDGDYKLGFIRRMHMVSDAGSFVSARLRVPYVSGDTTVSVSIFRGEKEERYTTVVHGSDWNEVKFPVTASPDKITAAGITADFPHAIHGRPERVLLRDFHLKGLAVRRIDLESPEALWDPSRELYYLQREVHPGSDLNVRMKTGQRKDLAWKLVSPAGKEVATGENGTIRHHFAPADDPGMWTIHISSGDEESTVLLLLRSRKEQGLIFDQAPAISSELLSSIRKRRDRVKATTNPISGMNIIKMDPHWLLPGLPSYYSAVLQFPEIAMLDAMEFRATGNPAALEESRQFLAAMANWPAWTHPWFPAHGYHSYYPVGLMTKHVVMAEQFLGKDLPIEERHKLDKTLMELSAKPIYEEYVLEDRLQFNTSNWIGNTVGGGLLAALQSEDPDAAGYALGLFIKERDHVAEAYTRDGSYGEGVGYQRFDLETTALAAAASQRLLGQSIDKYLAGGESFLEYVAYGNDQMVDYGDSHAELKPSNVFAYMASHNESDALSDFYLKYQGKDTAELLNRVLWESAIKKPASAPPAQPSSKLFDQRGVVTLRDSWSPDATVVVMRAGKNFNHNHADEGSVFFAHGGELWLGEAGYADYYKDPSYPTFNTQAIGHNTLLLDGDGESQKFPGNAVFGTAPDMKQSIVGKDASLVQADLTSAYNGKLKGYNRTLFFHAGSLVVIDQVQAGEPHRFTQVWHPKQNIASLDAGRNAFQLAKGSATVSVQSFATVPMETVQRESPMPLRSYEQAEHGIIERPVQVEISSKSPSETASIVTVIDASSVQGKESAKANWEKTSDGFVLKQGASGVRVQEDSGASSILGWWTGGALLLQGKRYEDREGRSISFSRPVNMEFVHKQGSEIGLEIDATEETELTLSRFSVASESAGSGSVIHLRSGHSSLHLQEQARRK